MFGHDDIWDEERWEAYLREHDKRLSRYMELVHAFITRTPPPETDDPARRRAWEQALRAYILRKGLRPDDPALDFLFLYPSDEEADAATSPDLLDADLAEEDADDPDLDSVRLLPIYTYAYALVVDVLDWTNHLPGEDKSITLVDFCAHLTQIPANIAKGHNFGYEHEYLGGNIACAKRALNHANQALDALPDLRRAPYMEPDSYLELYERLFELRNRLGLYVQDLRARFDLGID